MSVLQPKEGIFLQCDPTTKVFIERKNEELSSGQRFIIASLSDRCLFIQSNRRDYVQNLINEWVDQNSTPKKDEDNQLRRKV